jgi:hypothetical protein
MKRLEDIPKKNIFEVPEGYFDDLPSVIQARAFGESAAPRRTFAVYALRYALPVVLIAVFGIIWQLNRGDSGYQDPEEILATIDTPSLVAYLENSEVTTDELLESITLSQDDIEEIENQVYEIDFQQDNLNDLIDEYTFELNN